MRPSRFLVWLLFGLWCWAADNRWLLLAGLALLLVGWVFVRAMGGL